MSDVPVTILTAVVSSLVTAAAVGLAARWWLRRRRASLGGNVAFKVREAVERAADAAVPKNEEAVRSGLEVSVAENLPRVRAAVQDGVEDAVASAVTGGVVEKAGEELARKGTSVLKRILGGPEDR